METIEIKNDQLKVVINKLGAELQSVQQLSSAREYLWQGDATYWAGRSPVLFPIVGRVCDNSYRVGESVYEMLQHGIARRLNFEVEKQTDSEAVFVLRSSPQTKVNYPYDFVLEIGYRLEGADLVISYDVYNPSSDAIYFQLGAHPGFNFKGFDAQAQVQGYFRFNDVADSRRLDVALLGAQGLLASDGAQVTLSEKKLPITAETFSADALILESSQTHDISLLDGAGEEYLRVRFDAPVVGLWSKPCDGYAPFVCIEPWWGRCDSEGFEGDFRYKDWMQSLAPKDNFRRTIRVQCVMRNA